MSAPLPHLQKGTSLWKEALVRLRKNRLAVIGGVTVAVILLLCFVLAPVLRGVGYDANAQNLGNRFAAFGSTSMEPGRDGELAGIFHLLGTDQLGRDILMRVLEGGQVSLLVAILSTLLTVSVGVVYGGIAGYVGGRVENAMMRVVDGLLAMPFLIIVILFRELISARVDEYGRNFLDWYEKTFAPTPEALAGMVDHVLRFSNLAPLVLAIAAFGWLIMGRIVRAAAASTVRLDFVEAARSLGLSHLRILFLHILPNILSPIIIYATLTIPTFILYEATLSFIGLGIEPPNASWGTLIKEGANYLETNFIVLAIPAFLFSLTLFSFNFLGDGLRDALDVRSSKD